MKKEQQRIKIAEACGWKTEKTCLGTIYTLKADADQRAEAFLRTLNLWEDEDDEYEIDPRGYEERSMM